MRNRWVAVGLAMSLAGVFGAGGQSVGKVAPTETTIVGTDYAFAGVPLTLPPGLAFLAFRNEGKVRHEMSIARLKAGVTPEEAVEAMKTGGRRRDFTDGAAVLVVAGPGEESSRARLAIDLRKGETYIIVCTLKDKPDLPPHIMFGMYASFRVE